MKNTITYSTSESLPLSEPDVETNSLDFGIVLDMLNMNGMYTYLQMHKFYNIVYHTKT